MKSIKLLLCIFMSAFLIFGQAKAQSTPKAQALVATEIAVTVSTARFNLSSLDNFVTT